MNAMDAMDVTFGAGEATLGAPWPTNLTRVATGEMVLAGVPVPDLAAEFGTPAYLLDEGDFRARAAAYVQAFGEAFSAIGSRCQVYYAGKANLNLTIAKWAVEEGLGVDTASHGELATALRAGVPARSIGFHGNNKSEAELREAIAAGVGQIIVDSLAEIDEVARVAAGLGVVQPVLVRVSTGVHAGGHKYISTGHEDQKFGLSIFPAPGSHDSAAMVALSRVLDKPSLELRGIHSHIGSQIFDAAGFKAAATALVKLRADLNRRKGVLVPELNLGGGYGIAYLPGEADFDPRTAAQVLATTIGDASRALGTPAPDVAIEPGRSIVGPAGITIYTVGAIKPVHVTGKDGKGLTRLYVSVDGGMSDNIRPVLYQAKYHGELANRVSSGPTQLARVVGKHCESGDILIKDIQLPTDLRSGDLLAVAATGAYGHSMASNYNMAMRPPVISVADGRATTLVRRETIADLLARDLG